MSYLANVDGTASEIMQISRPHVQTLGLCQHGLGNDIGLANCGLFRADINGLENSGIAPVEVAVPSVEKSAVDFVDNVGVAVARLSQIHVDSAPAIHHQVVHVLGVTLGLELELDFTRVSLSHCKQGVEVDLFANARALDSKGAAVHSIECLCTLRRDPAKAIVLAIVGHVVQNVKIRHAGLWAKQSIDVCVQFVNFLLEPFAIVRACSVPHISLS